MKRNKNEFNNSQQFHGQHSVILKSCSSKFVNYIIYFALISRKNSKSNMTNELTPAFFKQVFLGADKDDDCKITLKQLGK